MSIGATLKFSVWLLPSLGCILGRLSFRGEDRSGGFCSLPQLGRRRFSLYLLSSLSSYDSDDRCSLEPPRHVSSFG